MVNPRFQLSSLYLFLFLSGFAGLGYEMVWTRMLSVSLGHEINAVLAVIAAFFAGLALGAYGFDGLVSRSQVPGRWYGAFELIIGSWALVLIFLIPQSHSWVATLMGVAPSPLWHWSIAFLVPFTLLLPATAAMGGTLPAMERLLSRLRRDGFSIGGLYGANTLGAVAGIGLTTFVIVPTLGYRATLTTLAVGNFVCAIGVLKGAARDEAKRPAVTVDLAELAPSNRLFLTLFVTGLLGIGYEVLVIRLLSQVLENTVYTFASILLIYLLGTALGAGLYQLWAPRHNYIGVLTRLLQGLACLCLLGVVLLWKSAFVYLLFRNHLGAGFASAIGAELGVACMVLFLPTVLMGATFSHLAQAACGKHGGFGRALALNTLGSALAPLLFGVILLPLLGSKISLILVAAGYLLLIPRQPRRWRRPATAVPAAIALLLWLLPIQLQFVTAPPGGRIVVHREGIMASVSVVKDARDNFHLKVNDHFLMGGTASYFSDHRQAHIPLLLHPDPKRALFLGLGTGATLAAAAYHPNLDADGVELVPEIIPLLSYFEQAPGALLDQPRLAIRVADARRFVQATADSYDVIIADLFHPARDGAGSLYTVEHFKAIQERLNPNGLFCQWLPLHQLDLATLRTIIRTFLQVYPDGSAYLAHYSLETPLLALISTVESQRYPADWFTQRVQDASLRAQIAQLRLHSSYSLFGEFIAGSGDLAAFAGDGPMNTDDFPAVTFTAPTFVYTNQKPAYARLLALIDAFKPQPEQLLEPADTELQQQAHRRLAAYWAARDNFLKAGVGVTPTADVRQLLEHVGRPLLAIVRQSPDFDAAYNPLLAMAQQLSLIDINAATGLLTDLEKANPQRPEARMLRERLVDKRK